MAVSVQRAAVPEPQSVWPIGHRQVPDAQLWPEAHAFPQLPQLAALESRFAHTVPQSVGVASAQAQPPGEHSAPGLQVLPQAPQFEGSVAKFTQRVGHASGSAAGHWHVPSAHASPVRAQAAPQAPQFFGSVCASTHSGDAAGPQEA
jgi:hypothetical protein